MDRITQLLEFLQSDPSDSFLQHALALEFIKIGEREKAYRVFADLLHSQPSYVGSYYHIAKLSEELGNRTSAIEWYEKGMEVAKQAKNQHSLNELRSAYEELIYE